MKLTKIVKVDFHSKNHKEVESKYFLNQLQAAFYLEVNGISPKAITRVKCLKIDDEYHSLGENVYSDLKVAVKIEEKHRGNIYAGSRYSSYTQIDLSVSQDNLEHKSHQWFFFVKSEREVYEINRWGIKLTSLPKEYLAIEVQLNEALNKSKEKIQESRNAKLTMFNDVRSKHEQLEKELELLKQTEKGLEEDYTKEFIKTIKVNKK